MGKRRVISNSGFYHVMMRGNHKENIFHSDSDRSKFLNILENNASDQFQIHCYCLMPNHIHLLVYSENISRHIKQISISYASWFNWKYNLIGHIFQGRFLSEVIESDQYYINCVRYILRNPIKAQICNNFNYTWSSFKSYYCSHPYLIIKNKISDHFINFDDFFNFLSVGYDEKFMDMEDLYIPSDEEIKQFLLIENIKSLKSLDTSTKKYIIQKIKENYPRVSASQIARVSDENRVTISFFLQ